MPQRLKGMLASAWRYRGFIASSIVVEFRARFARSRFGALWMIVQPLVQVAIFSLVLADLLSARLPGMGGRYAYVIYLMAGMLCWALFADVVSRCLTIFIENGNLIKKISFPRVSLPLIVSGVALINNAVLFLAIFIALVVLGHHAFAGYVWLPALIVLNLAFATGIGIVCGVLNVFARDTGQVVPVLLQVLYWFTPIVYTANVLPDAFRGWLRFNPLHPLVSAYQDVILFGRAPDWPALVPVAILATALLLLALFMFRRASAEMPDVL